MLRHGGFDAHLAKLRTVLREQQEKMLLSIKRHFPSSARLVVPAGGYFVPMSMPPLDYFGHFSMLMAIQKLQIWRFVTFQFLHADFNHLIFNMLALYFLGPALEYAVGTWSYLGVYLASLLGGSLWTLIAPPIRSTRREAMVRPRPVPP